MGSPLPTRSKMCTVSHFIALDPETDPFSLFVQIKSIAALGGLEIADPAEYVHMTDNKKPEFFSKFPHGKIPAFESQHGFKLFEAAAIACYGQ